MKKLTDKVKIHESKALRTLSRRQARKLAAQAAKHRCDAMKHGANATVAGGKIYTKHHPIYEELILPLLEEATRIASNAGFDILLQVRTPLISEPNFTHAIGGFQDEKNLTPTMKGCIDLIRKRPSLGGRFI
ncbi:hypothetical protein CNR34_00097 [Pseudomonas phage nickie]|uniref:Uncharacterized protein n=1 Tax=Pseudomonas phage nickie TaxID=2048977 RepID=A0A2H4P7L7_9CAUD|nr:hypothetical protein FDJ16_gp068 [Pseudomonas phage nickie]ATW58030.1 hypothetical protein CNR34_00097 [Pseudomonas phage nickie]